MNTTTETLKHAANLVGYATTTRGSMPILACLKFGSGTVQATNMEAAVTVNSLPDIEPFTIPIRALKDTLKRLDTGEVTITTEDNKVSIQQGTYAVMLDTIPADDFPLIPETPLDSVNIETTILVDAMSRALKSASKDETRPVLMGVLVEAAGPGAVTVAATDSYRLFTLVADVKASYMKEGESLIIPGPSLAILLKVLKAMKKDAPETVTVRTGNDRVSFDLGDVTVTSRVIEGQFPNYRQLFKDANTYTHHVELPRLELLKKCRRLEPSTYGGSNPAPTRFTQAGQSLTLTVEGVRETASDTVAVGSGSIGPDTFGLNVEFMAAGLESLVGDTVTLHVSGPLRTFLWIDGRGAKYLQMPVKLEG